VRVLVVEPVGSDLFDQLPSSIDGRPLALLQSRSLAEARRSLADSRVDLLVVDPQLPDGSGLELARDAATRHAATRTIVVTAQASLDQAIAAMRSGAADLLERPIDLKELNQRVREALARQSADAQRDRRIRRLRRICKKLNSARIEVTKQVDVLCNDLVTAYQELATQMQQVVQTSEFGAVIRNELDLEQLLRKTLEFVIQKAGPTNAAIFLPSTLDEYSLGGYVNFDCAADSADVLLDHLADVVAPRIADRDAPLHVTDNTTLGQWIGDDSAYLADSHVVGFPCRHKDETLAVMILFRDAAAPFDPNLIDTVTAIGPMLGESLARIIRIHHRHLTDIDAPQSPDGPYDNGDDSDSDSPFGFNPNDAAPDDEGDDASMA
jgi:DNA-binding response OmpR family regulator